MTSPRPDLVVAHYDERLGWLEATAKGLTCRAWVYTKGNRHPYTALCLPNVGREAHTYLYHIVRCYDRLADWTVFVQGDPAPHLQGSGVSVRDLLAAGAPGRFTAPWVVTARDWGSDGRLDWERFAGPGARAAVAGKMRRSGLTFLRWAVQNVPHLPTDLSAGLTYTPGACFGVAKDLILAQPKSYYEGLLAQLEHPLPEEAHYLERTWAYIFGGELKVMSKVDRARQQAHTVDLGKYGTVYCAHPCYGPGIPQSHASFWAYDVHPHSPYAGVTLHKDPFGSSLLPDTFNTHWKNALNLQLAGTPITRFLMLHDDIAPEAGWLGKLLAILDTTGADLVSVVSPLKDPRDLTSIALDDPDDRWAVYRRLSLKEVAKLPETFSAKDCFEAGLAMGRHETKHTHRALLPNTGCWACRMDRPWRHRVHFQLHSRIAFRLDDDWWGPPEMGGVVSQWQPGAAEPKLRRGTVISNHEYAEGMRGEFLTQGMSEDWDFGRQLAALGCDVRVTTAIDLMHYGGPTPFPNRSICKDGYEHDQQLAYKWEGDPYKDVRGWLAAEEGRFLRLAADGKRVLEIGSFCGKSTLWMAETAKHITCVDPFDGRGTPEERDTWAEFDDNLRRFGARSKVTAFRGTSSEALVAARRAAAAGDPWDKFEMAFIDGAHDADSVREDVRVATALLVPGGWLVFHDYNSATHVGVTEVVNDLLNKGLKKLGSGGTIAVLATPSQQEGTDDDQHTTPA